MSGGADFSELHSAVSRGPEDTRRVLQDRPELLNDFSNEKKQTPLIWAVLGENVHIVNVLLDAGAELDICDVYGYSAVTYAVKAGHGLLVHILNERGATMNMLDTEGHSLLHWAAYEGFPSTLQYVCKRLPVLIDQRDDAGATALHYACVRRMSPSCIRVLLECGADVSMKDHMGSSVDSLLGDWPEGREALLAHSFKTPWWKLFIGTQLMMFLTLYLSHYSVFAFALPAALLTALYWANKDMYPLYFKGSNRVPSPVGFAYMFGSSLIIWFMHWTYIIDQLPHMLLHMVWNVTMLAMYGLLYLTRRASTPDIPNGSHIEVHLPTDLEQWCVWCEKSQTDSRMRHCRQYVNQCLDRFDHVCGLTDCPIWRQNHVVFVLLVAIVCFNHGVFFWESVQLVYLENIWMGNGWGWYPSRAFLYFSVLSTLQLLGELLLLFVQLKNVFQNRTMLDQRPLFDNGLSENVKEFCDQL